jgi:hypothetical protein
MTKIKPADDREVLQAGSQLSPCRLSAKQPKGMPQECRQNRKSSEQSRAKTGANSRNERKAAYQLDGSGSQHS